MFKKKKIKKLTRFTYTYLPNGSGAGNHLGEGQGHMGMEQDGQSLENSRVCPYYTCLHDQDYVSFMWSSSKGL